MARLIFTSLSLLIYLGSFAQEGVNARKWELVWEDNFNFFDTAIWTVKDNFDHYGDIALYSEKNVYVSSGNLILEFKAEEYFCPDWAIDADWYCVHQYRTGKPYQYTSGMVESKAPYDTKYGHIEARIKFPYQRALWPAFWTFKGFSEKNPVNAAEIDIAEQLGELGSKTVTTNIHTDYCTEDKASYRQGCPEISDYIRIHKPRKYDWTNWHTYGINWTPKKIIFYVDGKRMRTIKNHGIEDPVKLMFNIGIRTGAEVDKSLLPQKMLVDYIRVRRQK